VSAFSAPVLSWMNCCSCNGLVDMQWSCISIGDDFSLAFTGHYLVPAAVAVKVQTYNPVALFG
jgi:hypothetical protein